MTRRFDKKSTSGTRILRTLKKAPAGVYFNRGHELSKNHDENSSLCYEKCTVHSTYSYVGYLRNELLLCVEKTSTDGNAGIVQHARRASLWEEHNHKRNGPRVHFKLLKEQI